MRKHLYHVEENWYKSFVALFAHRWKVAVESNLEKTTETRAQLNELEDRMGDSARDNIYRDKELLEKAEDYYRWLLRLIGVIESGQIFNLLEGNHFEQGEVTQ